MANQLRILVAEDNEALKRIIDRGLRAHGFEVVCVSSPDDTVALAAESSVRLVVLDLASANGVAADLRAARPDLPVLQLVDGEDAAVSDQHALSKPFAFEELIGRIRALTRAAGEERVTTLYAGDLRIDLLGRCAWRGHRVIELPDREFALLEYFVRHAGRVLSRQEILTDVWGYNFDSSSNLVDVYVRYLRNKLDQVGEASLIRSVRGEGYCLRVPSAAPGMKNSYRAGSA